MKESEKAVVATTATLITTITAAAIVTATSAVVGYCAIKWCGFFSSPSTDIEKVKKLEKKRALAQYRSYLEQERNELKSMHSALMDSLNAGEVAIKSVESLPLSYEVGKTNLNFKDIELRFRERLAAYPKLKNNQDADASDIIEIYRQRSEHHKKTMDEFSAIIEQRNVQIDELETKRAVAPSTSN